MNHRGGGRGLSLKKGLGAGLGGPGKSLMARNRGTLPVMI